MGMAVLGMVIAGGHLLHGFADLLAVSAATGVFEDDPLIPSEFRQASLHTSSSMRSQARISIVWGAVLALAGVIFWTCRRRLIAATRGPNSQETNSDKWFRRYALYGFATSCVGVLISPFVGVVTLTSHAVTLTVSEFLLLVGLGVSVLALAIGRDARIGVARAFMPYGLAILGTLSSGYVLLWIFLKLVRELSWQLQAWI
jgi:hypothetical protein